MLNSETSIDARIDEVEVLDLLTSLVDKSMVVYDESAGRYRLLETVRQYAREKMASQPDVEKYRRNYRDCFLAMVEDGRPKLEGPEQTAWLHVLDTEHDNLRQAITFCLEDPDGGEEGLRLGASLWRLWYVRGHLSEGRERLAALLCHAPASDRTNARATALRGAGVLAHVQSDFAAARSLFEESLAISRELGNRQGIAKSLDNMGLTATGQGDHAAARSLFEESLAISRETGNRLMVSSTLNNLGMAATGQRDVESARSLYEESLAIKRELGDRSGIANNLNNLGIVAQDQGQYVSARSLYHESLAIKRELGDRWGIANCLINLGNVSIELGEYASACSLLDDSLAHYSELGNRQGIASCLLSLGEVATNQSDHSSARSLLERSKAISRELGDELGVANCLNFLGSVASGQGDNVSARSLQRESLEIRRKLDDNRGITESLEALGCLNDREGRPELAARLWGVAERLREESGTQLAPNDRERYELDVKAVREVLGEAKFAVAWTAGRAMTVEQAIELALAS